MTIDVARARAETPGTAHVAHFNNAGSSLPPAQVLDAVHAHLDLEARIGGYEAEAEAEARLQRTRTALAEMLNCTPAEVALVENATVGWDMAFHSLPFGPGDRILTSVSEYASNYIAYLQVARRTGAVVEAVPNDADGQLDPEALERMIDGRVRLIAVTHVPTNGGLVNPAREIGRIARAHGIVFLLDACQSAGQMPLDVEEIGCDLLSATGRKYLRGPRGTGFLYVRRTLLDSLEPPFIDLHAATWVAPDRYVLRPDARRFENWENYVAGQVGLGVAVDYALSWGLDAIRDRVVLLADRLREHLETVPGVRVHDLGRERCGIVTFTVEGRSAEAVKAALAARGINVSVSTASSTRLDMEARGLEELVRASVHYYNTEEEIERLIEAVR
jgi:cysteine desulfurase/selenocysteine lyase